MSRIDRWKCSLPGDASGQLWPMVCVDEQSEAEYALYGDRPERKTFIFYDGSRAGRNQAEYIAKSIDESGEAVRDLGLPGIVAILPAECHQIVERRRLEECA